MSQHDPTAYGAVVGADYDALYPESHDAVDTDATVAFVAALASGDGGVGSVLEFGIGTGRIALALLAKGVGVGGIDGSAAMLAQLRGKPRGTEIELCSATSCQRAWTAPSRS